MWRKYFKLKGIVPGEVIHPRHGSIDLSRDDLDPDFLLKLWEEDFRYLQITPEGEKHFYGLHQGKNEPVETHGRAFKDPKSEPSEEEKTKYTAKELCRLIREAETIEEAAYYHEIGNNYVTVQNTFEQKREKLQ